MDDQDLHPACATFASQAVRNRLDKCKAAAVFTCLPEFPYRLEFSWLQFWRFSRLIMAAPAVDLCLFRASSPFPHLDRQYNLSGKTSFAPMHCERLARRMIGTFKQQHAVSCRQPTTKWRSPIFLSSKPRLAHLIGLVTLPGRESSPVFYLNIVWLMSWSSKSA